MALSDQILSLINDANIAEIDIRIKLNQPADPDAISGAAARQIHDALGPVVSNLKQDAGQTQA